MADPHPAPEMLPCPLCADPMRQLTDGMFVHTDAASEGPEEARCILRHFHVYSEQAHQWNRRAALASEPPQPVVVPGYVERGWLIQSLRDAVITWASASLPEHAHDYVVPAWLRERLLAALTADAALIEGLREALAMSVAEMSRARGRLETIATCNEDRRIAAALGSTCDFARRALLPSQTGQGEGS